MEKLFLYNIKKKQNHTRNSRIEKQTTKNLNIRSQVAPILQPMILFPNSWITRT